MATQVNALGRNRNLADVRDKEAARANLGVTAAIDAAASVLASAIAIGLAGKADLGHTHTRNQITDLGSIAAFSGDQNLRTSDSPTFNNLLGSQIRAGNAATNNCLDNTNLSMRANGVIGWNAFARGDLLATDLQLHRGGPGILEQRNGTAGQRAIWYKTHTNATNNEGFEIDAATNATTFDLASIVGSAGGVARGIRIGAKNAAGAFTASMEIATNHVILLRTSTTANSLSIGGNGANIVGNATWQVGGGWGRTAAGPASAIGVYGGSNPGNISFFHGNDGTVGGALTFTETMRLVGATGNLLIGTTTDSGERLQVIGACRLTADLTLIPSASRALATNGQLTFERVSNTSINLVYRGNDGTTRRSALTFT